MCNKYAYRNFKTNKWQDEINVSDFINQNYNEYTGDESFLEQITDKTLNLLNKFNKLRVQELKNGILDVDLKHVARINNFEPGYLSKKDEVIVGLQTDKPLKRIINPFGGMRMVKISLEAFGYKLPNNILEEFKYRKTHNEGVFDAYSKEIRAARHAGLLTGLPDAYGRGRIIGDYRRLALYGADKLIEFKKRDFENLSLHYSNIQKREEITQQIRALNDIKAMAMSYGIDVSNPAKNATEAVQFVYLAYLAGVKENNGAAMSLGRVSTFLDIYIERDLNEGTLDEQRAQELIDQFVLKLRMVRHLRTPEYNDLFAGDPTWVTESIGGMLDENKSLVTKNSYRILHTLTNMNPAPEPNMTVLWSEKLPDNFKKYCMKMSIETGSIQYENDDLMRPIYGNDYGIACCVSAMKIGKQMQYFGARINLAKMLLYTINGGVDERLKTKVIEGLEPINDEVLDYDKVMEKLDKTMDYCAELYVGTMNIIHHMHDKYAYEASQMCFHDSEVERLMAFGVAGLSVITDSLSAIKYSKVKPIRNEDGIAIDFDIEGKYPQFGNDDDRVDKIAVEILNKFINKLKQNELYRNAKHTLSVLTITSNVVYGKKTGTTPDGRKAGEPLAPGANPMHGRDKNGALASLNSVAKIPYKDVCQDGISMTLSLVPEACGKTMEQKINNLKYMLDGYFSQGAHHLNLNVLNRETLIDAMNNPENYPNLTIRVSGYAVNFTKLNKEQQLEVISRTFHQSI